MSDAKPKDVLTIEEAAELLGVSVKTFNKVLHSENIPGRKIGREWKFSRQALIDWIGTGRSDDFYRDSREIEPAPNGRTLPPAQAPASTFQAPASTFQAPASRTQPPGARRTSGWQVKND